MQAGHSLVLETDTGAGGTDLTGWALEFGVRAFADSTYTLPTAVTFLPVLGKAGGSIHGAVAGAACVIGIAHAPPALTSAMSW